MVVRQVAVADEGLVDVVVIGGGVGEGPIAPGAEGCLVDEGVAAMGAVHGSSCLGVPPDRCEAARALRAQL